MAIYKIFKATIPSMRYVFKTGVVANFVNGKFMTDVDSQIAELMEEVKLVGRSKSFHPTIYVDENEAELDSEAPTPYEKLKREMYEQALADIKRAVNPTNDMGSSQQNHAASVATSATIQDMTGVLAGAQKVPTPTSPIVPQTSTPTPAPAPVVTQQQPVDTNGDGKESVAEQLAALKVNK